MTQKEKREFLIQALRVNARFERNYTTVINSVLTNRISSLISDIKDNGLARAIASFRDMLILPGLEAKLRLLIKDVASYHARVNYRLIRREIAQKGFGVNEEWLARVMDLLRKDLLQYSVIRVTETFKEYLLARYEQGIKEGLSEEDLIKLIREELPGLMYSQAQRIARTEVNRSTNAARKVVAQSFDFEMQKEWVSAQDMRTRGTSPKDKADHLHMNGQTVNLEDAFVDPRNGHSLDFPSAPGGKPEDTVNCRCQMVTVAKRDKRGNLIRKPSLLDTVGVPVNS